MGSGEWRGDAPPGGPNLERSIALALVKGGLGKKGHKVYAPLEGGKTIGCTITGPVFLDPDGERFRG